MRARCRDKEVPWKIQDKGHFGDKRKGVGVLECVTLQPPGELLTGLGWSRSRRGRCRGSGKQPGFQGCHFQNGCSEGQERRRHRVRRWVLFLLSVFAAPSSTQRENCDRAFCPLNHLGNLNSFQETLNKINSLNRQLFASGFLFTWLVLF